MLTMLIIWFLPSLIALVRGHHNLGAIFLTNLLFGWTGIGWAIALVWSFTRIWRRRDARAW